MTRIMALSAVAFLTGLVFAGCSREASPAPAPARVPAGRQMFTAQPPPTTEIQTTFATPAEAVDAFAQAIADRDRQELRQLFGPRASELGSGDPAQDNADLQRLSAALQRGYRLADDEGGGKKLLIGPDSWEFPAPLVEENGRWRFDTEAGIEEVMDRRVGRNELDAIATSKYYVTAQELYRRMNPDHDAQPAYAARIVSTEGKHDGLYWPDKDGQPASPLGPLVASAVESGKVKLGTGARQPYRGYFFKILTKQGAAANGGEKNYLDDQGRMTGGFALLAWPAEYDRSGVKSFMVAKDGQVYQSDLGKDTAQEAEGISAFDPDKAKWSPVEKSDGG